MRLITRAVSATAAVLLLAACGGGSEGSESASETTASSTSAAETTSEGPAGDSEFCTQAVDFQERIASSLSTSGDDPAQVEAQIRQIVQELRAIEPPDEIADDWANVTDGFESIADTVAGATSANDPEVAAEFAAQLQELQQSAGNVSTYLQQECGIDTGISEGTSAEEPTAAPSS